MKKKKVIYTSVIITALTFIMGNIVFAKYYNNQNISTVAKIAPQIIELSKEGEDNKTITSNQGTELILSVSNYKDDKISKVGQNYYLQFYSEDIDISKVKIIATMNGENIELENMKTKKIYMKANKKEIHKYNIKITSNCNEDVKGNIKAKIISEQIEPK